MDPAAPPPDTCGWSASMARRLRPVLLRMLPAPVVFAYGRTKSHTYIVTITIADMMLGNLANTNGCKWNDLAGA